MKKLNEIKDIINKTIKLSNEFHAFLDENKLNSKSDKFGYTEEELEKIRKLTQYLESFDDDTILTIQAIMYIGRDGNYSKEEEIGLILNAKKEELGFATKEIEVNQMVSKVPLSEYLKAGLELLGI